MGLSDLFLPLTVKSLVLLKKVCYFIYMTLFKVVKVLQCLATDPKKAHVAVSLGREVVTIYS